MEILACPEDKHFPLKLIELESKEDDIISGVLVCGKCNRFYPIVDEIPIMLPDNVRKKEEDASFLAKWKDKLPSDFGQVKSG